MSATACVATFSHCAAPSPVALPCSPVWPLAFLSVAIAALQPLLLYLFIIRLEWGFEGVGAALICSQWLSPVLMLLYLARCKPHHPDTWTGLSCAAALSPSGVAEFLRLGLPGVLSMSEWWFWEVTCFTAGVIGAQALAAHTIVYNLIP